MFFIVFEFFKNFIYNEFIIFFIFMYEFFIFGLAEVRSDAQLLGDG